MHLLFLVLVAVVVSIIRSLIAAMGSASRRSRSATQVTPYPATFGAPPNAGDARQQAPLPPDSAPGYARPQAYSQQQTYPQPAAYPQQQAYPSQPNSQPQAYPQQQASPPLQSYSPQAAYAQPQAPWAQQPSYVQPQAPWAQQSSDAPIAPPSPQGQLDAMRQRSSRQPGSRRLADQTAGNSSLTTSLRNDDTSLSGSESNPIAPDSETSGQPEPPLAQLFRQRNTLISSFVMHEIFAPPRSKRQR